MSSEPLKPAMPSRQERRRLLTVYGRNAVLEALQNKDLDCRTLHLAQSNRKGGSLAPIMGAAQARKLPMQQHSREALARISRNGRQDQGVALDVYCPALGELADFLAALPASGPCRLLALDGVTNPQNAGMAIRSATAAGVAGVLYADRGNPALGPLVIKASAGTVFRAPLLRCGDIPGGTQACLAAGFTLYRLQAGAGRNLFDGQPFAARGLFVLGGETGGLSPALQELPGEDIAIPMANGVESLNVAVSASLVAYRVGAQRDR
ncbi:MAG: 23S rRNA (guanosine2251-2'-O)-methyltransferase [Halieaceae bacterium]|jgi:23S rRNA (guanosine2251-2'-O)-methyltransferase